MSENRNSMWLKVSGGIIVAFGLFSSGWGAAGTAAWMGYKRMDTNGTQRSIALESRVVKLETTLDVTLKSIDQTLKDLRFDLNQHMRTSGNPQNSQDIRP